MEKNKKTSLFSPPPAPLGERKTSLVNKDILARSADLDREVEMYEELNMLSKNKDPDKQA